MKLSGAKKFKSGLIFTALLSFLVGSGLTYVLTARQLSADQQKILDEIRPVRLHSSYTFTNPLLTYNVPNNNMELSQFKPLKTKADAYIKSQTEQNKISGASIYFRDMGLGRWVGINENENTVRPV